MAATGRDRTPIQIKPENINAWLSPEGKSLAELQAILDDRPEAYYEYRLEKAAEPQPAPSTGGPLGSPFVTDILR